MTKFNDGKSYHGSAAIRNGKLQGATDHRDYFYFFCPTCPDREIVRVLEWAVHDEKRTNPYDAKLKSKAKGGFTLVFKIHCEQCRRTDFVKISNTCWQGGKYAEAMSS